MIPRVRNQPPRHIPKHHHHNNRYYSRTRSPNCSSSPGRNIIQAKLTKSNNHSNDEAKSKQNCFSKMIENGKSAINSSDYDQLNANCMSASTINCSTEANLVFRPSGCDNSKKNWLYTSSIRVEDQAKEPTTLSPNNGDTQPLLLSTTSRNKENSSKQSDYDHATQKSFTLPISVVSTAPILRINVGGRSARIPIESILLRLDHSRLACFCEKSHQQRITECDTYFDATEEYYFEKSPTIFEYIIDYYITGKLHKPPEMCPIRLRDELDFWRISVTAFADCCRFDEVLGYNKPGCPKPSGLGHFSNEQVYLESSFPPALFDRIAFGRLRLVLWTFLENPRSSIAAKVLSIVSATFVLLSLFGLIMSSMPEFQEADGMSPIWYIHVVEICCMIFFTLEYLARLLVVPCKCSFVQQPLNVIDLLTILPFFAEECLPLLGIYDIELRNLRGPMVVIRVMRLARVARIFKLARYSIGLRAFGETMKKSAAELSMLGMFLLTGIMLFSTAIYFFEREEPNSKFYSIPSAWWWCVATMTTVGYGDLVPVTTGGKVVAAMASVCGIIVLAFPISMIIDKFAESTGDWRGAEMMGRQLLSDGGPQLETDGVETTKTSADGGWPKADTLPLPRTLSHYQRNKSKRASRRYLF